MRLAAAIAGATGAGAPSGAVTSPSASVADGVGRAGITGSDSGAAAGAGGAAGAGAGAGAARIAPLRRAATVFGPTVPLGVSPAAAWNFLTARAVAGPKLPSTAAGNPSRV